MAEKRFYWLKLKRDFFKRHDIRIIEAMPNGKDYILFYLKLLCESVDHSGDLRFSEQIPYDEQMLAIITNTNIDIVRSAVQVFRQLGMMEVLDDGTFYMSEVEKMLGSETAWAAKKRIYRENHPKGQIEDNVHSKEDNVLAMSDKSKSKSKSKSIDAEDISSVNDFTENELLLLQNSWNQRSNTHQVESIKPMTKRYDNLRLCLRLCDKQRIYDEVSRIDDQAFFQKLKKENRPVKFDWFFDPNNFQKVLEGNYRQEFQKPEKKPGNKFNGFEQRSYGDDFYASLEQKMGGG